MTVSVIVSVRDSLSVREHVSVTGNDASYGGGGENLFVEQKERGENTVVTMSKWGIYGGISLVAQFSLNDNSNENGR